jgi:hypothetical protein
MSMLFISAGLFAIAATYNVVYGRRDRTFFTVLLLAAMALSVRALASLYRRVESERAHSLSLANALESRQTMQTFLLTRRALARLVEQAEHGTAVADGADSVTTVERDDVPPATLTVDALLRDTRFGALAALLPERDDLLRRAHYGRCAVVGNSGVSLGLALGGEIDAHELVIRFNYPPLRGFERDVGNRTDWMMTGASTLFQSNHHPFMRYSDFPNDTLLLLFPRSAATLLERRDELLRPDVAPRLRFVAPFFTDFVQRIFTEYVRQLPDSSRANDKGHVHRPSSGLRGIIVALLACNHTDVYGFGASRDFGHGHYYSKPDAGVQVENVGHNYTLERRFLLETASGAFACSQLKTLANLTCGSLRVETRNAVPLAELVADADVVRLQSAAAAERVAEWQARKAARVNEREVRKERQANQRREQTNCGMVRRPSGDIWRCHFDNAVPPSALDPRELKEEREAKARELVNQRMGLRRPAAKDPTKTAKPD